MIDLELATMDDIMNEFVRRGDAACIIRWNVANMKKVEVKMTAVTNRDQLALTLVNLAKKLAPHIISSETSPKKPPGPNAEP